MKKTLLNAAVIFSVLASSTYSFASEILTTKTSVSFGWNSTHFNPGKSSKDLLDRARHASMVTIDGRTSTATPSIRDEKLALGRAVSARKYLIDHGVSPLKIYINYVSAGDFIVDNSTKEGMLLNQRVDITMTYIPNY